MHIDNEQLKQILLKGNYLTKDAAERAEASALSHHSSFTDQLLTDGLITNDLLGQAIAESFVCAVAGEQGATISVTR